MSMLSLLASKSTPSAAEPESFSAELLAAVAKGDGCYSEPTEADRRWAAEHLNRDWHATEPGPEDLARWSPEVPADVLEAEAGYAELARLAAEAEDQAAYESGCYAW